MQHKKRLRNIALVSDLTKSGADSWSLGISMKNRKVTSSEGNLGMAPQWQVFVKTLYWWKQNIVKHCACVIFYIYIIAVIIGKQELSCSAYFINSKKRETKKCNLFDSNCTNKCPSVVTNHTTHTVVWPDLAKLVAVLWLELLAIPAIPISGQFSVAPLPCSVL